MSGKDENRRKRCVFIPSFALPIIELPSSLRFSSFPAIKSLQPTVQRTTYNVQLLASYWLTHYHYLLCIFMSSIVPIYLYRISIIIYVIYDMWQVSTYYILHFSSYSTPMYHYHRGTGSLEFSCFIMKNSSMWNQKSRVSAICVRYLLFPSAASSSSWASSPHATTRCPSLPPSLSLLACLDISNHCLSFCLSLIRQSINLCDGIVCIQRSLHGSHHFYCHVIWI